MRKSRITYRGGRSKKYKAHDVTPTGREPYTGRWTASAAAAAMLSIKAKASSAGKDWSVFTLDAFEIESRWKALLKTLRKDLTIIQYGVAHDVLSEQRRKLLAKPPGPKRSDMVADTVLRGLRRNAAKCPPLPSIGIPPAEATEPATFLELIAGAAETPVRETPALSEEKGPLQYAALWGLDRVTTPGVVVFSRAGDRVREWRKKHGQEAQVELKTVQSIVHTRILPTATANKQDQWWLTGPARYMSVPEAVRCMGIRDRSPLAKTLALQKHPANAVQMLGRAVHAGVATLILEQLEREGLLPVYVRYGSACSGIDTMAEAMDAIRPGGFWGYVHAAELRPELRDVLQRAWAIPPWRLRADAAQTADAPEVDVYMLTPDCHAFSRRRHGRDADVVAGGAVEVVNVSPFVAAGRATVVIVENVDEEDGASAITTILSSYRMYVWRSQELDPEEHAGVPVARRRRFWVGVKQGAVRRSFPVHG